MPFGELAVGVEGYGTLLLYNTAQGAGCRLTDRTADISVTKSRAARLLYGPMPAAAFGKLPALASAFLPLPLSWNTLDYV